jgi:hypothetical protein
MEEMADGWHLPLISSERAKSVHQQNVQSRVVGYIQKVVDTLCATRKTKVYKRGLDARYRESLISIICKA